jgi:hypothetical protein
LSHTIIHDDEVQSNHSPELGAALSINDKKDSNSIQIDLVGLVVVVNTYRFLAKSPWPSSFFEHYFALPIGLVPRRKGRVYNSTL